MTDEQFKAIARAVLPELAKVPEDWREDFLIGVLASVHDITVTETLSKSRPKPRDMGRRAVSNATGWS